MNNGLGRDQAPAELNHRGIFFALSQQVPVLHKNPLSRGIEVEVESYNRTGAFPTKLGTILFQLIN